MVARCDRTELDMKQIDKNFFPGWVRKSISFTIDDGNLTQDKRFIDIVKKGGIKGTFNISNFYFDKLTPEGYREFYRGYEIANHVRLHPFALVDGVDYNYKSLPMPEAAEMNGDLYPMEDVEGVYFVRKTNGWRKIASDDAYIRLTRECSEEIRKVFGDVKLGFVWPYGMQKNRRVFEELKKMDFYAIRATGDTGDSTGFAIPKDRTRWSYNANNVTLLKWAKLFRDHPDDGELKTFIFGVHSVDFERSGNWCDLEEFTEKYGNRPEEFWYATNYEIFSYEDAVNALRITDATVENPSDVTVYITVDGEGVAVAPHSTLKL